MIRKGSPGDVPFMRSMLAHAYAWRVNQFEAESGVQRKLGHKSPSKLPPSRKDAQDL